MKIVAITQARTGSIRLPGKVLKKIGHESMLEIHMQRVLSSQKIHEFVLATTDDTKDDPIAEQGMKHGVKVFRGSETDVLDRYYQAAKMEQADVVIRITSDCPLIDGYEIDRALDQHLKHDYDFTSNIVTRTYPNGLDVEIFNWNTLERAWREARQPDEREHVTYYIWKNSNLCGQTLFSAQNVFAEDGNDYSDLRLTLDYPQDFQLFEKLIGELGYHHPWIVYANYLKNHPELRLLNQNL